MAAALLIEKGSLVSLIATTPALLDAEDGGGASLAEGLGVLPPVDWPPEDNGAQTRDWMRDLLTAHPDEPGYGSWYVVAAGRLVGICGFKGPPDIWGEVEIGYSMLEAEQRKGFGTEAARMLVARAFQDPRVGVVAAETLPALTASQTILRRNGFGAVQGYTHPELGEVLRFERRRPGVGATG